VLETLQVVAAREVLGHPAPVFSPELVDEFEEEGLVFRGPAVLPLGTVPVPLVVGECDPFLEESFLLHLNSNRRG
jgi:hypothetical protein